RTYSRRCCAARSASRPPSPRTREIGSRCSSRGISISGRCMSSRPERPEAAPAASASALELNLRALRPLLARSEVPELCINQPGVAYLETREGWQREPVAFADFEWCRRLAKLVANSTRQRIDEESPLLSAALPSGERIQIVLPPATSAGCIAISI